MKSGEMMERTMESTGNGIVDLRKVMDATKSAVADYKKSSEIKLAELIREYESAAREYKLATEAGLDIERIRNAESVIRIRGKMGERRDYQGNFVGMGLGDDLSAVEQAIKWMACSYSPNAYDDLNAVYFGTKDYDHWSHQRNDCEYGCGPRHGSIVFAIELREEHRHKGLTEQQRSDCIYYLEALKAGKLRQAEAKAA
jgi:hypothetical protein